MDLKKARAENVEDGCGHEKKEKRKRLVIVANWKNGAFVCLHLGIGSFSQTLLHFFFFFPPLQSFSSSSHHFKSFSHSLPFHPLPSRWRNLRKLACNQKNGRNSSVKAIYSSEFWEPERPEIWSTGDDLQIPSSPYFPAYDYAYAQGQGQGQGLPPMMQESFQSVISQPFQHVREGTIFLVFCSTLLLVCLFSLLVFNTALPWCFNWTPKRIIRCGAAVDDMANIIVAQLLYLDAVDPKKDIVMYVNSPGGSVTAGMAIFDTMRHIRPDVSTVCVGLAASMGAFLLSSGTKGKRYSLPNSRIMIHQPLGGAQGGQTDIDIQANEMLHHKANLNGYLAYHTGLSLEKINQDTDRDFFMNAKEAEEYWLIDGVIMNPLKAFQPLAA